MAKSKKLASKPLLTAPVDNTAGRPVEVTVLHVSTERTLKAVEMATRLSKDLAAEIRLLVLQVVPYPLPLDTPDVPVEFIRNSFAELVAGANVRLQVDIRLGRDRRVMFESAIRPGSVVLIGCPRPWWPTPEMRAAKRLGCSVIHQS